MAAISILILDVSHPLLRVSHFLLLIALFLGNTFFSVSRLLASIFFFSVSASLTIFMTILLDIDSVAIMSTSNDGLFKVPSPPKRYRVVKVPSSSLNNQKPCPKRFKKKHKNVQISSSSTSVPIVLTPPNLGSIHWTLSPVNGHQQVPSTTKSCRSSSSKSMTRYVSTRRAAVDANMKIKATFQSNDGNDGDADELNQGQSADVTDHDDDLLADALLWVKRMDADGDVLQTPKICTDCWTSFKSRSSFDVHFPCFMIKNRKLIEINSLIGVDAEKDFCCGHCFRIFDDVETLKGHIHDHYQKRFQCRWFNSYQTLDKDMSSDANLDMYSYSECIKVPSASDEADENVPIFSVGLNNDNYFDTMTRPDICGRRFTSEDACVQHIIVHHMYYRASYCTHCETPNKCGLPFAFRKELQDHILDCHDTNTTDTKTRHHHASSIKRIQHSASESIKISSSGRHPGYKRFRECFKCGKGFDTRTELLIHSYNKHHKDRVDGHYICDQFNLLPDVTVTGFTAAEIVALKCGKIFETRAEMFHHLDTHFKVRLYQCLACDLFYPSERRVQDHIEECQRVVDELYH